MMIIETPEKGRCVFADKEYKKGETIEICEYITIPQKQIEILKGTVMNDYWFGANGVDGDALILLGAGSLYNHSAKDPNMIPIMEKDLRMGFIAGRDIQYGEELVFDYGYTPNFQVKGNYSIQKKSLGQK